MNERKTMSRVSVWMAAVRPKTLWAGVAPIAVGTGLAASVGGLHIPSAILCLLVALLLQIGTNFCNDLADFLKGADTEERVGPLRVTQAGLVSPGMMRAMTVLAFALAGAVCLALMARAGWPLAVLGVVSVMAGVAYTAGPYPLAYLGLGDLFVLIFFGPVAVAGTYFVQTLAWSWLPVVAGVGPGLLSVAILVVNNLRDIEGDAKVGKRTLAVRFGPTFARVEYTVCVAVALVIPVIMGVIDGSGFSRAAFPLLALIPLSGSVVKIWRLSGAALNPLLGRTAFALLIYSLLMALAWMR